MRSKHARAAAKWSWEDASLWIAFRGHPPERRLDDTPDQPNWHEKMHALRKEAEGELLAALQTGKLIAEGRPSDDPLADLKTMPQSFWCHIQRLDEAFRWLGSAPFRTGSRLITADPPVIREIFVDEAQVRALWPAAVRQLPAIRREDVIRYANDHPGMTANAIYKELRPNLRVAKISRADVRDLVPKQKPGQRTNSGR